MALRRGAWFFSDLDLGTWGVPDRRLFQGLLWISVWLQSLSPMSGGVRQRVLSGTAGLTCD